MDAGAAVLVADDKIDDGTFERELTALLDDSARRDQMRAAARELAQESAASALADRVEAVARS